MTYCDENDFSKLSRSLGRYLIPFVLYFFYKSQVEQNCCWLCHCGTFIAHSNVDI